MAEPAEYRMMKLKNNKLIFGRGTKYGLGPWSPGMGNSRGVQKAHLDSTNRVEPGRFQEDGRSGGRKGRREGKRKEAKQMWEEPSEEPRQRAGTTSWRTPPEQTSVPRPDTWHLQWTAGRPDAKSWWCNYKTQT